MQCPYCKASRTVKARSKDMTKKGRLSDFAGMLTEKEASDAEKRIKKSRKRSAERVEEIRKRMSRNENIRVK